VENELNAEQWIAAPLEQVFRFFADPCNLAVISPPSSGAHPKAMRLAPPNLPQIDGYQHMAGVGSEIEVSFRLLPYFPFRGSWTARIVAFEWLNFFRDLQVSGPFRLFDHTHTFLEQTRNGIAGTIIRDHVEYDVGFGVAGALADRALVRILLKQMFDYRHTATERALVQ
jgi:ligand-binding SRPBCC domain-containing protein